MQDLREGPAVNPVKVADLSRGGVCLISPVPRALGERGCLHLRVNKGDGLLCGVVIVHAEPKSGMFMRLHCRFQTLDCAMQRVVSVENGRLRVVDKASRAAG